jgi:hypothetical protein
MYASRIRGVGLAIAASLGLSACMSPYGYSSVGVGIGSGGYYDDYGYGGYGYGYPSYGYGYGSGYGYPSYGWYDDFYYPGSGYYVYSRDGSRHRWTDTQRRYWESRRDRRSGGGLKIYQPRVTSPTTQSVQSTRTYRPSVKRTDRVERREVRREGLRVKQNSQHRERERDRD